MTTKILITGIGGPTPRSFVKSIKNFGSFYKYDFVGTDCNRLSIGLYQNELFRKTYLVPRVDSVDYWSTIETIIKDENIDFAVILPELEVLEWAKRSENGELPCKTLVPNYDLAKILVDKATMTELLYSYGLVPKSFVVLRNANLDNISEMGLDFPFWIRSSSGSSGLGSLKVGSLEELKNWIHINPKVDKFLASEFLPGRNLACKLLYQDGKLLRSAVAERVNYIMAKVAPSGITGNTSFGRLLNDSKVVDIASKAMDILFEHIGCPKNGFFTVDLKEDEDGTPKVTEVNVRFVAFNQCYAAGGANLAEDFLNVITNDESFDTNYKQYEFEKDLIFLRDVDELPIVMKESDLLI
jgi:carbamoyl-phosphate synthase large subunit